MAMLCLQVRAGPVHLMLDASAVHEVLTQDARLAQDGVERLHVQWRGGVLPVVVLAEFLGFGRTVATVDVVYSPAPDAAPIILAADEVVGLFETQAQAWRRLPPVPEPAAGLFDAVYIDPADPTRLAYRLRTDIDPSLFEVGDDQLLLEG
jgi:hypothetical protein